MLLKSQTQSFQKLIILLTQFWLILLAKIIKIILFLFFVSVNSTFAFISIETLASSSFIQLPRSTSLALPLYTIFTNKILTVSNFLKEHNYVITLLTSSSKEIHLAYSLMIFCQFVNCLFILLVFSCVEVFQFDVVPPADFYFCCLYSSYSFPPELSSLWPFYFDMYFTIILLTSLKSSIKSL